MDYRLKNIYIIILISLALSISLLVSTPHLPLLNNIHWKLYDRLLNIEYRLKASPSAIKDILLVTIDNETLKNMPQRWPYPRSDFAKVIQNLKEAEAKVIGFDFVFFGKSTAEEDALLKKALKDGKIIILASLIDEESSLDFSPTSVLSQTLSSGIITKLQDSDGIARRNLTYLVSKKESHKGFLSWEMRLLITAKKIRLSSLTDEENIISFKNESGKKWAIPVDSKTKSFLIHFRAHTTDFKRLSFYQVFKGNFDPALVKDKIVLVGLLSSLLGDIHNTPLGWLPGITLNANVFLTLYTQNFLKNTAKYIEWFITVIGTIVAAFIISLFKTKKALLLIGIEVILFFVLSYILLSQGYIWNYSLFPFAVILSPILSKKFYLLSEQKR